MSKIHTMLNTRDRMEPPLGRFLLSAIETVRAAVYGFSADLTTKLEDRRAMRRIARFSDHRLQDIAFERDWDGSIVPVIPDPRYARAEANACRAKVCSGFCGNDMHEKQ
ncbi:MULTISPECIES: hypothetical protein [unclassified Sinorhizobium]|uniref:hypothetical protein n=1 Tax=unclassified Sinorhizobium TaxID=2613772 RepID=UPI0035250931